MLFRFANLRRHIEVERVAHVRTQGEPLRGGDTGAASVRSTAARVDAEQADRARALEVDVKQTGRTRDHRLRHAGAQHRLAANVGATRGGRGDSAAATEGDDSREDRSGDERERLA